MSRESTSLAVLFADVCDSTRLYEEVGDDTAQSHIAEVLSRLARVTGEYRGSVIKSIGDEVMCTFPSPDLAADAAIAMNRLVCCMRQPISDTCVPVSIHAGFHAGPVVLEGEDVYGDAVNVAARMTAIAKPRQILTTRETLETLQPQHRSSSRYVDRTTVKGKVEEIEIFEVLWDEIDVTVITEPAVIAELTGVAASPIWLELAHGDRRRVVDVARPCASLGRLDQNDIAVDAPAASRYHARIEYRRGKFVLVEQSSNGTFVKTAGGNHLFFRREEAPLMGSGVIGLGEALDADAPNAIRFRVEIRDG